ncbi:MAG: nucleoside hydrolase [Planctomycetota bacterium]
MATFRKTRREGARRREIARREFLGLAAAAGFLAGARARWLFAAIENRTVSGRVFGGSAPLPGARVSDGLRVAKTDASGRYEIDVGPDSGPFLFVTTPPGYWRSVFYLPTAEAAATGAADFRLDERPQPPRFRFVFWTDIHLEGGEAAVRKFRRTIEEVNALEPAFVWAMGDITLEGKAGKRYLECLEGLRAPIRNGPGNHEMLVREPNPRGEFEALFGPTYYSFEWAGIHCVVLDGCEVVSDRQDWTSVHGGISERELRWLEADLEAKPRGAPVVAAIHIPLFTTFSSRGPIPKEGTAPWVVRNAERVHELLRAHEARLVLQGHLHENERLVRDGVEYATSQAVSGSWWASGEGFERGTDGAPRGYRVVEVDGTRISHRFVSSAESHIEARGEFRVPSRPIRPERYAAFLFHAHDVPAGARFLGRIDGGGERELLRATPVSPTSRRIRPNCAELRLDTTALAPGEHAIEVEVSAPGEIFRESARFSLEARGTSKVPVIYCTDLHHPHVDPDDHFDLAAIFAIPEIDVRAIVLDDGVRQKSQPGAIPVRQMLELAGKKVPFASGLAPSLRSPSDAASDQPEEFQGGVRLILETLRASEAPVTVVAVGSLRDVAAAWNRDPALCVEKVGRVFAFIGDAHSEPGFAFREYNATLDVSAYRAVFESGLRVFWVPCFDGGPWKNAGRASFWQAEHRDLLRGACDPLKRYFVFALERVSAPDPVAFLREPVDAAAWERVLGLRRNLWCCAAFLAISDGAADLPFSFEPVYARIDETGMALYPEELPRYLLERFRVADPAAYPRAMTALTAELLARVGRT